MRAALEPLARRVDDRAQIDGDFARIVDALLLAPTAPYGTLTLASVPANGVNRRPASMRGFVGGPLDFAHMLDELLLVPTTPRGLLEHVAARNLNERRRTRSTSDFVDGALTTTDVRHLLRCDSARPVDQLLDRGELLGVAIGHQTLCPAWQFDGDRLCADLPRLLGALSEHTTDVLVADRMIRLARDELDGSSLAEAIRDPRMRAVAWHLVESLAAERAVDQRRLPSARPEGGRSRWIGSGTELWRVEPAPPVEWTWDGVRRPGRRFDSASGAFRVRHVASNAMAALHDRYVATGRVVPSGHAHHHLARLTTTRRLRVQDPRPENGLEALDGDGMIGTGRCDDARESGPQPADAARIWRPDLDAIVYRSPAAQDTEAPFALLGIDEFAHESWRLAERGELLTQLVLNEGFTVGWDLDLTSAFKADAFDA